MPPNQPLHVLLAEDSRAVAELVGAWLADGTGPPIQVTHVWNLADALEWLDTRSIDLVLLDLSLPDSAGLATLRSVIQRVPETPVVVLTGTTDPELAVGAVREGAQDYLFKQHMDRLSVRRAIVYAIERHRRDRSVVEGVDAAHGRAELHRLASAFERAPSLGRAEPAPLRQRSTESFETLAHRYVRLLDAAVHTQEVAPVERTRHLVAVADSLGALRATPKDVLDLHATALKARARLVDGSAELPEPEGAGQVMAELLGHVSSYYRRIVLEEIDSPRRRPTGPRPRLRTVDD